MKKAMVERFTVARIAGKWEELYGRDTKKGYRQRCDMTASVEVRTVREFSRDRNGKKLETVQQFLTGESQGAIESYAETFPQVPSIRISSMIRFATAAEREDGFLPIIPCGIMVRTQY